MKPIRQPLPLFLVLVVSFVMLVLGLLDSFVSDGGFGAGGGAEGGRLLILLASLMGLLTTVIVWAVWPLLRNPETPAAMGTNAISEAGSADREELATVRPASRHVNGAAAESLSRSALGLAEPRLPTSTPSGFVRAVANHDPVQAYKAALDQAPVAMLIADRNGRIEYVNDAFLANVGYERVEVIGRSPRLLGARRAGGKVFHDLWQTIVAGDVWRGEILGRHKNGSECWERVSVSPLRDASLRISRFVAVCEDVTEHKRREEGLHQLARLDPLTGVSNRRHLMERARHEWGRAHRFDLPLALIMLDIDHFKRVNDEYGHAVGDRAICAVATICEDCVREIDIVGRYGGEEFVIVLPGTDLDGARKLGRRLRKRIAETVLQDEKGHPFALTASLGIAQLGKDATLDRLLALADAALYRAKRTGRNRMAAAPAAEVLSTGIREGMQ
jgi:diguanylate cyclase (GGDEF)-like protein/PAS domain S-box-containing protein